MACVDVAFLMSGPVTDLHSLADHVRASSSVPLCLHLVADSAEKASLAQRWRMQFHSLAAMPREALALHRAFANLTHGPGAVYMWKPLLHLLLPMRRLLLLDSDVAAARDFAAAAAARFEAFGAAVVGLAAEQAPFYYLNGYPQTGGLNGGVQLLDLEAMRRSREYNAELHRFAAGQRGEIGFLGDQNFYTSLRALRPELVHTLDCGWNRQLSTHLWGAMPSWVYECDSPCSLVHGNHPTFKAAIAMLHREPPAGLLSCAKCEAVIARSIAYSAAAGITRLLAPAERYMWRTLHQCCCAGAAGARTAFAQLLWSDRAAARKTHPADAPSHGALLAPDGF
ncbi:hypothetical protein AB1Y20_012417 [Prymnesium parvum]|uniref:Hexosyltransferase n=1 Tax=Prymnesium parvum TaxID=97485 RepID=A0AB34IKL8_PRYPA